MVDCGPPSEPQRCGPGRFPVRFRIRSARQRPAPCVVETRPGTFSGGPFMGKKLYVGNLTWGFTNADLEQLFAAHGAVQSAQIIMDRDTGRSKGFGFVEMGSDQEAQAAIQALHGKDIDGRQLTVNEARPKTDSRGGGGGGGYGGGGGGGCGRGGPGGGGGGGG